MKEYHGEKYIQNMYKVNYACIVYRNVLLFSLTPFLCRSILLYFLACLMRSLCIFIVIFFTFTRSRRARYYYYVETCMCVWHHRCAVFLRQKKEDDTCSFLSPSLTVYLFQTFISSPSDDDSEDFCVC